MKGTGEAIGMRSLAADMGVEMTVTVHTDSSAAAGMCRRTGIGRVRHLAVADLWVQDRVRTCDFQIKNIAGADNAADMLTKHVERPLLKKHMATLGLFSEDGRASLAPRIE